MIKVIDKVYKSAIMDTYQANNAYQHCIRLTNMRNKHTNKALKNGNAHFNHSNYTTGYIEIKKNINIFTLLKYVFIIITMLIVIFHLLNKYL